MNEHDPIVTLARLRIIRLSAELEVQLSDKDGGAPAVEILKRFREQAAESLASLITINFADPNEIPKAMMLQNEVKRYDEMFNAMKDIIVEGKSHDQAIKDEEREEMFDVLTATQEGRSQLIELGLIDDVPRD